MILATTRHGLLPVAVILVRLILFYLRLKAAVELQPGQRLLPVFPETDGQTG